MTEPGSAPARERDAVVAAIADTCRTAGVTVAAVESLTSGALASALGRGEGAADWFRGAVIAYQLHTKAIVLGVDPEIDPSTPECAAQLATNGRALLDADVCVSVTGVGGPEPSDGHPAGEVHIGISTAHRGSVMSERFRGDPQDVVDRAVMAALRLVADVVAAAG